MYDDRRLRTRIRGIANEYLLQITNRAFSSAICVAPHLSLLQCTRVMARSGSRAGLSPWHRHPERKDSGEIAAVEDTGRDAPTRAGPPAAAAAAATTTTGTTAGDAYAADAAAAIAAAMRRDPFVGVRGDAGGANSDGDWPEEAAGGGVGASGRRKPTVLVINTGGTLGMRKDDSGGLAPVPGYFTSQMLHMEGDLVRADEMPFFDIVEYDPLLDSSCFQPSDWARIAVDIGRAYHFYDGFVVCMGTDTMAYAASALSFMLENLGKTVVFTGSQIPLAEVYNDARRNVVVAMMIAGNREIPEVCLFFCDRLLRANRAVKVDSLALTAYDSPNFPPLGNLGVTMRYRRDVVLPPPRGPFRVHTNMDSRVVVIKLIPGYDDDALIALVEHCTALRAVVLELYGTGNSPSRREDFVNFIKIAKAKGILVVAVTQCLRGGVSLGTYAVGVALESNGVISGGDMTTEAVVTKLAYLFGLTNNMQVIRRLMTRDLRGELSPSSSFQHPLYGDQGKIRAEHGPLVDLSDPTSPASGGPISKL